MLPLHLLPMNRQRQILGHNPILINNLHTSPLQLLTKQPQPLIPIQLGAMNQPPRPRKNARNRVRARLFTLLVLPIVAGDRPVCGLGFDDVALGGEEFGSHHSEGAETLGEDVGLDVAVVVFAGPDEAAGGFDGLGDHVVYEAVFVVDVESFELGFVLSCGGGEC